MDLPPELICIIISYLGMYNRNYTLVCKQWYDIYTKEYRYRLMSTNIGYHIKHKNIDMITKFVNHPNCAYSFVNA